MKLLLTFLICLNKNLNFCTQLKNKSIFRNIRLRLEKFEYFLFSSIALQNENLWLEYPKTKRLLKKCENFRSYLANAFAKFCIFSRKLIKRKRSEKSRKYVSKNIFANIYSRNYILEILSFLMSFRKNFAFFFV